MSQIESVLDGEDSDTHPGGLEHHDRALSQELRDLLEILQQYVGLLMGSALFASIQDHAGQRILTECKQFPEVGVRGNEHARLSSSKNEEIGVGSSTEVQIFDDMNCVMSGSSELFCDSVREALVDQELHALSRNGRWRSSTAAAA